jgi:hypothetical protein
MFETFSSIQSFLNCQTLYYWRQVREIEKDVTEKPALYFGKGIHEALDAFYTAKHAIRLEEAITRLRHYYQGEETPEFVLSSVMMKQYAEIYKHDDFQVVESEKEFETIVYHPENRRKKRFHLKGRRDSVVRMENDLYLCEHKTAGFVDANYLDKLRTDYQILLYSAYYEQPISGTIYNILVKPRHKPGDDMTKYREKLEKVFQETSFFTREIVYWSEEDFETTKAYTYETLKKIHQANKTQIYTRNTGHCFYYNNKCQYWDLCSNLPNAEFLIETSYRPKLKHPELSQGEENATTTNN